MSGENTSVTPITNAKSFREFGRVRLLNKTKAFAIIHPDRGGDHVFVSLGEVQQSGIKGFGAGVYISYRRYYGSDGRPMATDLALSVNSNNLRQRRGLFGRNVRQSEPILKLVSSDGWLSGKIKWYDPNRHYGFVEIPGNSKDVFLHKSILSAYQLEYNKKLENISVQVMVGSGLKPGTTQVIAIVLA